MLRRTTSRTTIEVNDTAITPADMMAMPEPQRLALLKLVSTGRMSMDEAMAQVVEYKNRQNCVIA